MVNKIFLQFKYEIIICLVTMVQKKPVHNGTDFEADTKKVVWFFFLFIFVYNHI